SMGVAVWPPVFDQVFPGGVMPQKSNSHLSRPVPIIVEQIERRRLLSGGPILTDVNLLGNADGCTGVVLTFDRALDVTRATDARLYVVGRIHSSPSDTGSLLG